MKSTPVSLPVVSTLFVVGVATLLALPAAFVQANGMPPIQREEPMPRSYAFTGMSAHAEYSFLLVTRKEARSDRYERDAHPAFEARPLTEAEHVNEHWRPAAQPVGVDVSHTLYAVRGNLPDAKGSEPVTEEWLAEQEEKLKLCCNDKFPRMGDRGRPGLRQTLTYRVRLTEEKNEKSLHLERAHLAVYNARGDRIRSRDLDGKGGASALRDAKHTANAFAESQRTSALLLTLLSALAGMFLLGAVLRQRRLTLHRNG